MSFEGQESTGFVWGKPLTPSEVYYTAVGLFKKLGYGECEIIRDASGSEHARCFEKDGRLYILHYPSKDNDKAQTVEDTTESISNIARNKFSKCDQYSLNDIHEFFIVAESNRYLGFPIRHYVLGYLNGTYLAIVDSKNRAYNVDYIVNTILLARGLATDYGYSYDKNGHQGFFDNWSCGHQVVAAISRIIKDGSNDKFKIRQSDLDTHTQYYQSATNNLPQQGSGRQHNLSSIVDPRALIVAIVGSVLILDCLLVLLKPTFFISIGMVFGLTGGWALAGGLFVVTIVAYSLVMLFASMIFSRSVVKDRKSDDSELKMLPLSLRASPTPTPEVKPNYPGPLAKKPEEDGDDEDEEYFDCESGDDTPLKTPK